MDRIKVRYSEKAEQFPLKRGTEFSAGFDLRVFPSEDRFTIAPGRRATFGTGVSFEIPPGLVGIVASRSGLGFRGLVVANGIGVIDSDYRGEVSVCLLNTSLLT
jgi:dUTP pyrophosphatase